MTPPAQVDVKGKGKPRGRRRPRPDEPATETPSGPPAAETAEPEAAEPEAAEPEAAEPEAAEPEAAEPEADEQPAAEPEAANEAPEAGPGGETLGAAREARERESRRERRAREQAEEAAEIEAAALGERKKPSRRERRARERAEAAAVDTVAVAPAAEETRREPRAIDPARGERRAASDRPTGLIDTSRAERAGRASRAGGRPQSQVDRPPPGEAPRRPRPGTKASRAVVLRQRRRRRRTIIGTTIFLVVFNLLVGGTYAYFQWRLDQISRVQVPGLSGDIPGQVMNVLLVGSDSRERLTGDAAAQAGKDQVGGQRSDTIMVLHVDPRQKRAAILSIPRDLYLPIAGTQESDRVNSAFATGGAERLITTLVNMGIQVNHYAEVDFVGFREIVDAMGGVTVHLPNWARDFSSGLDIPRTGCVDLNGTEALAYVRSRDFETLVDGKWSADPRGDLGRIERQQDFIRRVMRKGVSTGISNPIALNRLIGIGVRNLTVDTTMSTSDITEVARRFRTVDPDSVETLVLPTAPQMVDGKDVLVLKAQEAQDEIAKINGFAPTSPPTTAGGTGPTASTAPTGTQPSKLSDVRVQVLNGNGQKGAAKTTGDALQTAGFRVVGTGDAQPSPRTVVRHAPAHATVARAINDGLEVGAQLQEDTRLRSADVVLLLGTDYKGFKKTLGSTPTVAGGGPAPPLGPEVTTPRPPC